ncbi:MAG: hypothetical protein DHS20C10_01380 [marine bacterium B5-7]|nr:MAG: hypothetical protein DHS20C10_01380 [marine bacterium B5-7]
MSIKPVTPEDLMSDEQNTVTMGGKVIRKASMAAILGNADILDSVEATEQEKQDALAMIAELAPGLKASGLLKHVTFKNSDIQAIFDAAK